MMISKLNNCPILNPNDSYGPGKFSWHSLEYCTHTNALGFEESSTTVVGVITIIVRRLCVSSYIFLVVWPSFNHHHHHHHHHDHCQWLWRQIQIYMYTLSTERSNNLHICGDKNTELERHQQNTQTRGARHQNRTEPNQTILTATSAAALPQRNRNNLHDISRTGWLSVCLLAILNTHYTLI